jgi:hypothetical protein
VIASEEIPEPSGLLIWGQTEASLTNPDRVSLCYRFVQPAFNLEQVEIHPKIVKKH